MELVTLLFYPVYLLVTFSFTLIFIPKKDYKEYFIYGFLFGALGDVLIVSLFQNVLQIMWFKNMGLFAAWDQNFLSPASWLTTVMLFLYFFPQKKFFRYPYIFTFSCASVGYGLLVRNADLFDFRPWLYPYVSFFVFFLWWLCITWIFLKTSSFFNTEKKG